MTNYTTYCALFSRCIRHRKDWGALILVDDRFRNNPNKYITGKVFMSWAATFELQAVLTWTLDGNSYPLKDQAEGLPLTCPFV